MAIFIFDTAFAQNGNLIFGNALAKAIRALLRSGALKAQITDAEIGTGKKPLVLVDGQLRERVGTEGVPIVFDGVQVRVIAADETLLL